jgi:hypothetical protein
MFCLRWEFSCDAKENLHAPESGRKGHAKIRFLGAIRPPSFEQWRYWCAPLPARTWIAVEPVMKTVFQAANLTVIRLQLFSVANIGRFNPLFKLV